MEKFWAMKSYKSLVENFIELGEIGIDQDGIDVEYSIFQGDLPNKNLVVRNFDRFCKYMDKGDYIFIGIGERDRFRLKLIGKITGDYRFNMADDVLRHRREIEILREFKEEIEIATWQDIKEIESINSSEAMDIILKYLTRDA